MHALSDIGKRITAQYYENAAQRSYFFGCSEGGRSVDRGAALSGGLRRHRRRRTRSLLDRLDERPSESGQALHKDPASFIAPAKLPIIQQAALAACDARDGVKDGLVSAPQKCKFDPQVLACKKGGDESQCLTAHSKGGAAKAV